MLRTNVEFLSPDGPPKSVLVTSALIGEGKSTVAIHLAAASAAAGRRTLLVECDLRRPVIAERLGIRAEPGIAEYLRGETAPQDVLQVVPLPAALSGHDEVGGNLVCIVAGKLTAGPAELLSSPRLTSFFEGVREAYDLVVIDTPPLLAVADPLELLPHAGAVLLCVRINATRRGQAQAAKEALSRVPGHPMGLVVTGLRPAAEDDYQTYTYAYYRDGNDSALRDERPSPAAPKAESTEPSSAS